MPSFQEKIKDIWIFHTGKKITHTKSKMLVVFIYFYFI